MSKFFAAVGVGALLCSAVWSSEFSEAQAKVREKYPEEFAAIQKLAATDIAEAQKKLVELAKKGNIRVPSRRSSRRSFQEGPGMRSGMNMRGGRGGMGMMRMGQFNLLRRFTAESQIKSKFAAEYAAADKKLLEAVAEIEKLASQAKVTLPVSTELQIRKLRARAPEDFARLEELSASDPRAVFGGLRELAEKNGIELWEVRRDIRSSSLTLLPYFVAKVAKQGVWSP